MTMSTQTLFQILQQYQRENHVLPSPREGHFRIVDVNNDVFCAIEKMGCMEKACRLLGAPQDQIDRWIDEHYVPEPFASTVQRHTDYSIWSLQTPTFYINEGPDWWPHTPTQEQLTRLQGIGIYKRRTNAAQSHSGK